ncbi:MAG: outer membrane protein assembly factor BamA [Deltaproteobacteria bacterium HGW-Deltaproteobacteria-4]|nr:MAG: outer membrane protein assembly factor BamA [Deltaproteobacteria bacterium HGW-Deltaproteobacteria-4]
MVIRSVTLALLGLFFFTGLLCAQDYKVDEVIIAGTRRVDPGMILAAAAIDPGPTVSADNIDRATQAIFRLARFSDVRADLEEKDGKSVLIFTVVERPLVRAVKFAGNKELSEEKLRALITIKPPDLYDATVLDRNIEAVLRAYKEAGYYAAKVEPQLEVSDLNEAIITLNCIEGDEILIDSIGFEGNKAFTDKELKKGMETRERWFLSWMTGRGAYQEEVLNNDLSLLTDRYFDQGYIQVKVHQPQVTMIKENRYLDILIEIEEGEQYRIGAVEVAGDLLRSREELIALLGLPSGQLFSRKKLREGMMKINDLYADEGYAYVNVAPLSKVDPEARTVDLTIEIEKSFLVTTRKIAITGNSKTIDKVIRREMMLNEGENFSATKIKESRRRIQNLGFFEEVKIATEKADSPTAMDLLVEVKEKPTGTFSLGFGYSTIDGFIGQTSVTQDNLLGRGYKGNLSAAIGSKSTTYQFGLLDPHFLDTDLTLGFDLYRTDREWTDFSKKANGGNLKLGIPFSYNVRSFFVYRYEEKEIYDVSPSASLSIRDQEGYSTLSSIYASLSRNTTDYRMDPRTGSLSSASIEFAGLGGTEKFVKYELDHRRFYPLFWKFVFSAHGRLGYVQEVGSEPIPIDERYYLGGLSSLRGFESREVGPRIKTVTSDSSGNPIVSGYEYTGGTKVGYGNLEITFPLIEESGFKGVIFYDAGNTWAEDQDYFSDVRHSAGFGLRWMSPLGPLRLEWGKNLDQREGEASSDLQFSIGTMF